MGTRVWVSLKISPVGAWAALCWWSQVSFASTIPLFLPGKALRCRVQHSGQRKTIWCSCGPLRVQKVAWLPQRDQSSFLPRPEARWCRDAPRGTTGCISIPPRWNRFLSPFSCRRAQNTLGGARYPKGTTFGVPSAWAVAWAGLKRCCRLLPATTVSPSRGGSSQLGSHSSRLLWPRGPRLLPSSWGARPPPTPPQAHRFPSAAPPGSHQPVPRAARAPVSLSPQL